MALLAAKRFGEMPIGDGVDIADSVQQCETGLTSRGAVRLGGLQPF
jgi:hypothetical protein